MRKTILFMSSVFTACILTLAGCNSDPESYVKKRIERAKLLNHIRADEATAKSNNDQIDKIFDHNAVKSASAEIKRSCNSGEIDKIVKYEGCYVDKLKNLHNTKAHSAELPAVETTCYAVNKFSVDCTRARDSLAGKLNAHTAPRK
jgi:ABC-type uncharacterized transport system auxiliary subunit